MSHQQQLPNMPELPPKQPDHEILGIPDYDLEWIIRFIEMHIPLDTAKDASNCYLVICRGLTKAMTNPLAVKVAGRYLKDAAESYVSYMEMLVR